MLYRILIFSLILVAPPEKVMGYIPADLTDLVNKDLNASQRTMSSRGYEVVYLSFFKKTQYWWNESSKTCISLRIKGGKIEHFSTISNQKCESAGSTIRKEDFDYFVGSAPVRNERLDTERVKLYEQGLKPAYWIKSRELDRSIEYWVSTNGETCKHLIFETIGGKFVSISNDEFRQCMFLERAKKM